jgi:urea transporter
MRNGLGRQELPEAVSHSRTYALTHLRTHALYGLAFALAIFVVTETTGRPSAVGALIGPEVTSKSFF